MKYLVYFVKKQTDCQDEICITNLKSIHLANSGIAESKLMKDLAADVCSYYCIQNMPKYIIKTKIKS